MTSRILPREEWPMLEALYGDLWRALPPETRPVVVEQDGAIVGAHLLLPVWHVEGLWIAPAHRGRASVARRLWQRVREEARALGVGRVLTAADDDRVRGLLAHVGAQPLPDHFVMAVN